MEHLVKVTAPPYYAPTMAGPRPSTTAAGIMETLLLQKEET